MFGLLPDSSPRRPSWGFRVTQYESNEQLTAGIDGFHGLICTAQRQMFRAIAKADRRGAWRDSGARDMAHWLAMRQGISLWKACRWVAAAHALQRLPRIAEAFARGELGTTRSSSSRGLPPRGRIPADQVGKGGLRRGDPPQGRPFGPPADTRRPGGRSCPNALVVVLQREQPLRALGRATRLAGSGGCKSHRARFGRDPGDARGGGPPLYR